MTPHIVSESEAAPLVSERSRLITALADEIHRERGDDTGEPVELRRESRIAEQLVDALADFDDRRPYLQVIEEQISSSQQTPQDLKDAHALDSILRRFGPEALKAPGRLGVCPAVVAKALALLQKANVSCSELEKIASCDPILATSLLGHANSALYERNMPVSSVAAAVAYIGLETAKRVILAASARPLFASVGLRDLWAHSVDVAAIAEQIAAKSGVADAGEAFTAGLIHDIGRLAFELSHNDDFVIAHHRLSNTSKNACFADVILTGQDHGKAGARLLSTWRLPPHLSAAVRDHHTPEQSDSPLASILYLSEVVSGSVEEAVVPARFEHSLRMAGLQSTNWLTSDIRRLGTALAMAG